MGIDRTGKAPLERLDAGEIDVNGYIKLKVEEATAHLRGLPRADLDEIKAMLREKMATDPALIALVNRATGRATQPPDD